MRGYGMFMSPHERICYYLGDCASKTLDIQCLTETVVICHQLGGGSRLLVDFDQPLTSAYDKALHDLLLRTHNSEKKFMFFRGDNSSIRDPICIVKNRCAGNSGVILRCMNYRRHWWSYFNRPADIPFDHKANRVFWRGTTTGHEGLEGNRFDLVTKWCDKHKDIDIGFSRICQGRTAYNEYVKGPENTTTFLKCKYILSVRGNDKDSGLQWKLNSNSAVLMAKPVVTSWLMESTLVPDYHYVLLKDDFSDLEEILNWCNGNQDKCRQIVQNANLFMKQFEDEEREEELEAAVINKYFELLGR